MTLPIWTTTTSFGLHALLGVLIVFVLPDPRDSLTRSMRVPIEMRKVPERAKPPPPPPPPPVPVPPPLRPRRPRTVNPKPITMPPPKAPRPAPPPATEPEPTAPPVFGVTMESVVEGDSSVSAPIGNTLEIEPPEKPRAPEPVAGKPRRDPPDVVPPRVRRQIVPPYPRAAAEAGIEGKVLLLVEVDEKGRVTNVRVLRGLGHGLDEAAVEAVRQFTFTPGTVDGRPGPMEIRYTYTFVLDE